MATAAVVISCCELFSVLAGKDEGEEGDGDPLLLLSKPLMFPPTVFDVSVFVVVVGGRRKRSASEEVQRRGRSEGD